MTKKEKKQAEEAQKQECVKDLGRFIYSVIPDFSVGFIPVIERKKRLN